MGSTRERTLVGLFVALACAILIATLLHLTGGIGASRIPLRTYFRFSGGLDSGGVVRYGGLAVGKITRVRVDPSDSARIEIDFAVDPGAPVKEDSVARVSSLGLLSENFLEISPGAPTSARATAGTELRSKETLGLDELEDALGAMLPKTQKTLVGLNLDLDGLHETINRANDLLNANNRAKVASTLTNLDATLADLRPELRKTLENLNATVADADKAVNTTNAAVTHVDNVLGENRSDIRSSVSSLQRTLAQTDLLVNRLNATMNQNSDNVDDTLENIRQVTENLRQLTEMLKNSPSSMIFSSGVKERRPGDSKK